MKKLLSIVLTVVMLFSLSIGVFADNLQGVTLTSDDTLVINSRTNITLNDKNPGESWSATVSASIKMTGNSGDHVLPVTVKFTVPGIAAPFTISFGTGEYDKVKSVTISGTAQSNTGLQTINIPITSVDSNPNADLNIPSGQSMITLAFNVVNPTPVKTDTMTVVNVENATYDGAAHGGTATVTGLGNLNENLAVYYKGRNGTVYASSTTAPTNAGDYTASASYAGNDYYNSSSGSKDFTILKADTTTSITISNAVYNGNPHEGTATVTGAGGLNENLTVYYEGRNGTTYASSSTAPTNAGEYKATATYLGGTNHLCSSDSRDFIISKADSVVENWPIASAIIYGQTLAASTLSNGKASVDGTFDFKDTTIAPAAGNFSAEVIFTPSDSNNYNSVSGIVDVTVNKATPTITILPNASNITYGQMLAASILSGGEASVDGTFTFSDDTISPDAGNYSAEVIFTPADTNNYNTASCYVSVTIDKADAVINVTGYNDIYDGDAHGADGTATGVKGEDLSYLLNLGDVFTDYPGGTAHWSFAGNNNYNATSGSVDIIINKADADIDVTGYTGTYDGKAHGATGTATGVKGEDLSKYLSLGEKFTDFPGGTASWTFSGCTNYKDASGSVDITINKANAAIDVTGYTGTYDGNAHGATGIATGVNHEDLSSLLNLGDTFTDVPGGTANWTFEGNINYNEAHGSAVITITKAISQTVISNVYSVKYGTLIAGTATVTGVGGLNERVDVYYVGRDGTTYPSSTTPPAKVGKYTATARYDGDNNHFGSYASVDFSITYDWLGIQQPINYPADTPTAANMSRFKSGSTIPIKFKLGGGVTDATATISYLYVNSNTGGVDGEVTTATATGGTVFRYDAASGQYIFNMSTKGMQPGTYKLMIKLNDGETYYVFIGIK